jgi:hypothetical protein
MRLFLRNGLPVITGNEWTTKSAYQAINVEGRCAQSNANVPKKRG